MSASHAALNDLLQRELTLSASQISQGSKSHNFIRELLGNKWPDDSTFPRVAEGDFLSGSYARGTKIHPLNDIDVMIVIDGTGLLAVNNGSFLNAEVRGDGNRNPILQHMGPNNMLSSKKVLQLFHDALRQSHPGSQLKKDGQAVNVWLDSYGLGIDVVPCFHILPRDGSRDFYYIPEGNNSDHWISTNPKIDEEISDALNKHHNMMFKDVVRLIKYWNRVFNLDRLQSYHLETVAWRAFPTSGGKIVTLDMALMHFFGNALQIVAGDCPDMTGLGGPVDSYLSQENRLSSLSRIGEAAETIRQAYVLSPSEDNQLRAWRYLLGEKLTY